MKPRSTSPAKLLHRHFALFLFAAPMRQENNSSSALWRGRRDTPKHRNFSGAGTNTGS